MNDPEIEVSLPDIDFEISLPPWASPIYESSK